MTREGSELGTSPGTEAVVEAAPAPPAALPDAQNPVIIDARKTIVLTVIGTAMFIASVIIFIL